MKLELHSDQFVQTYTASDRIAPKNFRAAIPNAKLQAKILIRFFLEESDLALVAYCMAEVSIPGDSLAGDAFDLVQFDRGIVSGRVSVLAHVVVSDRNEQIEELKIDGNHGGSIVWVNSHVKQIRMQNPEFRIQ